MKVFMLIFISASIDVGVVRGLQSTVLADLKQVERDPPRISNKGEPRNWFCFVRFPWWRKFFFVTNSTTSSWLYNLMQTVLLIYFYSAWKFLQVDFSSRTSTYLLACRCLLAYMIFFFFTVKRAQEVVMFGNQQNKLSEHNYVRADKRGIFLKICWLAFYNSVSNLLTCNAFCLIWTHFEAIQMETRVNNIIFWDW